MKFYEDKTYIKMCEKAKEIQDIDIIGTNRRRKRQYDIVSAAGRIGFYVEHLVFQPFFNEENEQIESSVDDYVWIPRQDQPQEMSPASWIHFDEQCKKIAFETGINLDKIGSTDIVYSKEKAGLMFVMKEKYSKTWNGEDWVKNSH